MIVLCVCMIPILTNGIKKVVCSRLSYLGVNSGLFFSVFMNKPEFGYILKDINYYNWLMMSLE